MCSRCECPPKVVLKKLYPHAKATIVCRTCLVRMDLQDAARFAMKHLRSEREGSLLVERTGLPTLPDDFVDLPAPLFVYRPIA